MSTAVYIDGFNLYYGMAKALDCRWVNIHQLFTRQFAANDIRKIYFFEALINGPHRAHQESYVRAVECSSVVQVVLGEMKAKLKSCKVSHCTLSGNRSWQDYEEKHTDVSIAIHMVDDAHRGSYDRMILVTADTDLVPAARMVKLIRPQTQLTLCIPAMHKLRIWGAKPLAMICDDVTRLDAELFLKCQLPRKFQDSNAQWHNIPVPWRSAPVSAAKDWKVANPSDYLKKLPNWCPLPK